MRAAAAAASWHRAPSLRSCSDQRRPLARPSSSLRNVKGGEGFIKGEGKQKRRLFAMVRSSHFFRHRRRRRAPQLQQGSIQEPAPARPSHTLPWGRRCSGRGGRAWQPRAPGAAPPLQAQGKGTSRGGRRRRRWLGRGQAQGSRCSMQGRGAGERCQCDPWRKAFAPVQAPHRSPAAEHRGWATTRRPLGTRERSAAQVLAAMQG